TGDIVKEMEKENFDIAVTKGDIQYVIPASQITIEKLADRLNVDADKLEKIEVEIKMNAVSDSVLKEYKEVAQKMQHELIVPPVEFEVVATATGTDGAKHEVNVDKFSNYVERIIEIPANLDPSKITTGIVFNADGTYSHVPTTVFKENGKYYARINSLTNSVYSVIYNHVTVDSVKGHWAEETNNDMASRLVLVDYANFDADSAITRAEFADYIVRALGLYRDEDVESTFSDISESNSYKISIQKANEWGIISGYPDGSFKADKTITREEAMAMYARAMNVLSLE
ncbi:MAG: S-layer homology domain-containing protein, partial [Lachnospiraceae bacterium]|nr:S-layer homology domain-containing protein [Lachnospiraceae bacterium]